MSRRRFVAFLAFAVLLLVLALPVIKHASQERPPSKATATPTAPPATTGHTLGDRLGVFTGSEPQDTQAFEKWLGRKVIRVDSFNGRPRWQDIAVPGTDVTNWNGSQYQLVIGVPLLPDAAADHREAALRAGGEGRFNKYFISMAKNLVADGHENAILRLGWEFNIDSWTWGAGDSGDYKIFFRKVVTSMRSVPGEKFKFDWNVNNGYNAQDGSNYYPGEKYVDYIGVDVYDYDQNTYPYPTGCNAQCEQELQKRAWNQVIYGSERGLKYWASFAKKHDKPLSLPEWGLWKLDNGYGGADDPYFIQQMYNFITNPSNNVAYANYFDFDEDGSQHGIQPTGHFPQSSGLFHQLFSRP